MDEERSKSVLQKPTVQKITEIIGAVLEKVVRKDKAYTLSIAESEYATIAQQSEIIAQEEIVNQVIGRISQAKQVLRMTMLLSEELSSPLPVGYHRLIGKLLDSGVDIHRLGFGTAEDFELVQQQLGISSPNFTFSHIEGEDNYQRMILVDDGTLFFNADVIFYKTGHPSLISLFNDYFDRQTDQY
ncbi:MAG: hypothetical protein UU81_C0014G0006 [Microgenomates group bacterium GW2011_GWC1_41_8]|uniref:Uncharacterized protein n=2 Tax=Candidatus Roizmaniibacteriota TaxID=1752723 RepID=A0A0G0VIT5_9BACT|nr:MAG: hypothetical protein UU14_C0016G0015 [Candidatus Roizmanbacteria bacterium GW2011_GWB1_40_7]KKR93922.1 MAG: hypothetical protein UU41_C0017G0015 [Candidatus Roizmanbacteria bacterium GW2011_GWA1_41_13]KKS23989.1 MAG: hypothetical protein UU81_C0014G0006 [Microgenomates group bacterium GW2011_GWC1_41_8]OGK50117.1 MAG: hypothetical protein A3A55_00580 [Candidatus Roizmanbacteria bacterium RIFCSPLOWO2_01_FULL_40_14]